MSDGAELLAYLICLRVPIHGHVCLSLRTILSVSC